MNLLNIIILPDRIQLSTQSIISFLGPSLMNETNAIRDKRNYYLNRYLYGHQLLVNPEPPNDYMKNWITYEHNRYRRMMPASDMNMLYWSDKLAASAQLHANTCDFRHSRGRINIGENIWVAPYRDYSQAITLWFNEVYSPQCGCNHAYKHCCGHYVQVVWAQTNLVGCGFARCRDIQGLLGRGHQYVFVCHYNPQGNTVYVTATGQYQAVSRSLLIDRRTNTRFKHSHLPLVTNNAVLIVLIQHRHVSKDFAISRPFKDDTPLSTLRDQINNRKSRLHLIE
ncbi:SCP-like protein [Dictyocaulus viviparus]|uniref:SCP-like protein n=1 Tax=Dictyocaulus viviparus TaxID=29172 RepID=A0A0D8YAI6_DICVI|nr:SCP-like protein [Dictyocaulus viviparus]